MIDSLYHSSRGGVKTLVDYKINYEKALLFIKKDLNRPNGSVQIYRNLCQTKKNQPLEFL